MRPQPGNALQEGREKKGDSDTDLRGQISVLLLFFSSSSSLLLFFSGFWPGGVLEVLARGGPGGSGPWESWGFWPVGILGSGPWGVPWVARL